tara:strand:+ start:325 stop:462 length:138 start_codon:yes stop_codon:yes gene_type:complete
VISVTETSTLPVTGFPDPSTKALAGKIISFPFLVVNVITSSEFLV